MPPNANVFFFLFYPIASGQTSHDAWAGTKIGMIMEK
jgi:hypothetical protein